MLRVLLLDDEEDALDLLEILLLQVGDVDVIGRYTDPFIALDVIGKLPVDLVFLDIDMPGMKGTQVARKIKESMPQLKIVFTTAYSEYAVEAFEIQSNDYLLKPITLERLQLAISRFEKHNFSQSACIQCMGGFFLFDERKRTLSWKMSKEKEVCAFLIHHCDMPVDTDVIIEAIWPEHEVKKARSYLYTCLSYLRKALMEKGMPSKIHKSGKGFIFTSNGLVPDEVKLKTILLEINSNEHVNIDLYNQLKSLYKGEYLEGCGYDWALSRQMELKNMYIKALRKFDEYFREDNNMLAEECLQRILTIVPDSEKDGRDLMRLYIENGKRNEAINVYRLMEQNVLDLGVELEVETIQLYEKI